MIKKLGFRLINWFLSGLLLVVPLAITIYFIYWVFISLDGLLGLEKPGLGFVLLLVTLTFIGFISSQLLAKQFWSFFESVITKAPLIKLIYTSIKDLIEAFVGDKKRFKYPVRVKMANEGVYKLGFVTQSDLGALNLPDLVAVYFPHSYNFSGNLFLVEKSKVIAVDANPTDFMKFIVSGGVSVFENGK